jgi:predicted RNA-binding Zn-ribbon protein involved in translation (DUF1610 family)
LRDSNQITVLPLKCSNCSSTLKALEEDVVFLCPNCQTCWEFKESKFLERKLFVVKRKIDAPKKLADSFYLPFWYIDRAVLIPAFLGTELIKLGKYFTLTDLERSDEIISQLYGASLYSWEAERLVSLVAQEKGLESRHKSFEVAAIPFALIDSKFIDLVKGTVFYPENIDNFKEIYKKSIEK